MGLVASEANPLAFAMLYERHLAAALALAQQICSQRSVAEEVVQEAFLSLWRGRHRYDPRRGEVRPWLLWTVRNRAIDAFRQSVPRDALHPAETPIEHVAPPPDWTEQEARRREHAREVLAVLENLPDEQSVVITLAYYGGYTHAEIASMLDMPLGTIKGRMRLGLRKMADGLIAAA